MTIFLNILAFTAFLALLVKSADIVHDSLIEISKSLKISPFISGFIILSVASTLPEISVAINSVAKQAPDLSVGNLLGATVFLLTAVVGSLAIRSKSIPFAENFSRKDVLLCLLLISLQSLVYWDKALSVIDGLILVSGYIGLLIYLVTKNKPPHNKEEIIFNKKKFSYSLARSLIGIILLLVSANFIVNFAINITSLLNVSETLIGLFVLSIGTNLPELTIMFTSNSAEKEKVAIGNFIGSAVANVLTLGMIAIISPHKVEDFGIMIPALIVLLFSTSLLGLFAWTNKEISQREGSILLGLFVLMVAGQLVQLSI